ncbi:MAG: CsbD family protein [Acidobacteriaceae bacterium]
MNKHTVRGKIDQTAGRIKEKVGDALGNQKLANAGVAEQIKGIAQQTYGNVQDTIKATTKHAQAQLQSHKNDMHHYSNEKSKEVRGNIRETVEGAQKKVNTTLDNFKEKQKQLAKQAKRTA